MAITRKTDLRSIKAEPFAGIFDLDTLKINPVTHKVYADVSSGSAGLTYLDDEVGPGTYTFVVGKIIPLNLSNGDNASLSFPDVASNGYQVAVKFTGYSHTGQTVTLHAGDTGFIEHPIDGNVGDGPFTITQPDLSNPFSVTAPGFRSKTYWEWTFWPARGWMMTGQVQGTVNQIP